MISIQGAVPHYSIAKPEDWVRIDESLEATSFSTNDLDKEEGVVTHLLEYQYDLRNGSNKKCVHFIDQITSQSGVNFLSKIPIEFMAIYQHVVIHHLKQYRNGKLIDQLNNAHFQIAACDRKQDGKEFQGWKTLTIILNDLQIDDTLDICYTVNGCDPKIGKNFSTFLGTRYRCPVALQRIRVVYPKAKKIFFKSDKEGVEEKFINSHVPGCNEPIAEFEPDAPVIQDENIPLWCKTSQYIQISTFKSWSDVVKTYISYYERAAELDIVRPFVDEICKDSKNLEEKIIALVNYVQKNIRYLSLSEVDLTIAPSNIKDILLNKFGDCKDKTLLLLALLDVLGVEAYPALVYSADPYEPQRALPCSSIFDHIIVLLKHSGKEYWIDPTFEYQGGTLEKRSFINRGYALVLKPSQNELTEIPLKQVREKIFKEYFDFSNYPSGPIRYRMESIFKGIAADIARDNYLSVSKKAISERFLDIFCERYGQASVEAPLTLEDDQENNVFTINESYIIEEYSSFSKIGDDFNFMFSDLRANIQEIPKLPRTHPLPLTFPNVIQQTIEIDTNTENNISHRKTVVANKNFHYLSKIMESGKKIIFTGTYEALTDQVSLDKLEEYSEKTAELLNNVNWIIYKSALDNNASAHSVENNQGWFGRLNDFGKDEPNMAIRFLKRMSVYILFSAVAKIFLKIGFGIDFGSHREQSEKRKYSFSHQNENTQYSFSSVKPLHQQGNRKRRNPLEELAARS